MDTPTLTLEEVAELACIETATLHDWLQLNGPFNAPSGDIEQLGPFTALAVCIAAELVRRNFEIFRAAHAGKKFDVNPFVVQIERKIGAAFASLSRKQMHWLGT
jgi:hypothetical protein